MTGPVGAGTAGLNATPEPQHLAESDPDSLSLSWKQILCDFREFNKRLLVFLGGGMPTGLRGFTKIY